MVEFSFVILLGPILFVLFDPVPVSFESPFFHQYILMYLFRPYFLTCLFIPIYHCVFFIPDHIHLFLQFLYVT